MSLRSTSSRTRTDEKPKGATKRDVGSERLTEQTSSSNAAGSIIQRDSTGGSIADKKMLRAWTAISKNRGKIKSTK
jgi:hypothetical protein